jgi:hypothetical protein
MENNSTSIMNITFFCGEISQPCNQKQKCANAPKENQRPNMVLLPYIEQ